MKMVSVSMEVAINDVFAYELIVHMYISLYFILILADTLDENVLEVFGSYKDNKPTLVGDLLREKDLMGAIEDVDNIQPILAETK